MKIVYIFLIFLIYVKGDKNCSTPQECYLNAIEISKKDKDFIKKIDEDISRKINEIKEYVNESLFNINNDRMRIIKRIEDSLNPMNQKLLLQERNIRDSGQNLDNINFDLRNTFNDYNNNANIYLPNFLLKTDKYYSIQSAENGQWLKNRNEVICQGCGSSNCQNYIGLGSDKCYWKIEN